MAPPGCFGKDGKRARIPSNFLTSRGEKQIAVMTRRRVFRQPDDMAALVIITGPLRGRDAALDRRAGRLRKEPRALCTHPLHADCQEVVRSSR
jgi:hypothetical protein